MDVFPLSETGRWLSSFALAELPQIIVTNRLPISAFFLQREIEALTFISFSIDHCGAIESWVCSLQFILFL